MRLSDAGLNLIQHFEGFSAVPYQCPAGYWTIGYGHRIDAIPLTQVTVQEACAILRDDVRIAERAVMRFIAVPLFQPQFDALVSFTFNLGSAALQRSTLRRVVNRGAHDEVPRELMRWVWAGGRKLAGLARRRAAEGALYCS